MNLILVLIQIRITYLSVHEILVKEKVTPLKKMKDVQLKMYA